MAYCAGAAVAYLVPWPALADSARGPLTAVGNAMNPGVVDATADRDPAGLSPYRVPASRTPSGQLYDIPYLPREMRKSASGWEYSGFIEAGILSGDASDNNALFRRYGDVDNGPYLNSFGMEAIKPDEARFVEIVGGGVGRNDQFYDVRFGRYNDYRVDVSYSEIPHVYSTTARPVWQGVGTGNLTLPAWPGVAPGGASANNNTNATALKGLINASGETELGLVRKKGGVRFDMNLTDTWTFFSSYSLEHRKGTRPFGGDEGNGETVEPIDYKTHNLLAGLQFANNARQFNLSLSASFFRNDIDTLTWQNPFRHPVGTLQVQGGRMDLYPDNDAYNAKMEYAQALPSFYNGRFHATVALSAMRQNDNLIPPTVTSGTGTPISGGFNGNFNLWNTSAALSQQSANASIDTRLVDLGLSLAPADKLTIRGALRHYQTLNHTSYAAFNPQTGQYGYIIQDTNANDVFNGTNNVHYRSIPFQGTQDNYKLGGEYQVRWRAVVTAEYERENFQRDYRERDKTWEDRVRFGYTDRGFESATLRLAYEYADRRGSPYNSNPYQAFYTASLATYTDTVNTVLNRLHNLEELRKYDLADRRQQVLKARVNYLPRADMDLGLTLQAKINTYPADFGRTGEQTQNALNLDLNYLPSAVTTFNAYFSYQTAKMKQAGAADLGSAFAAGCAVLPPSCSNSFGAPLSIYPADQFWSAAMKDRTAMFGLGLRHDFGKPKLDVQYTYSTSRSPLSYTYASANALQSPGFATQAGNGFPDLKYDLNVLDMGLRFPISPQTSVRLFYHFEIGKLADWHYSGLDQSTVVNNLIYLDAGPRNYRVQVLGAFVKVTL
ncbi:MAG: MtrB/PioB family decaheme-associated outer membrane protein [Proteobacteria bacterium]|nr:MtrB/PioB family decaheme-associated outer membrane protein [Pseudomonadota bacterium]